MKLAQGGLEDNITTEMKMLVSMKKAAKSKMVPLFWPLGIPGSGARNMHAFREELMAERELLANHSNRVVQFEEVCRAVDAEVVAQAHVMKLKDSLKKQMH